MKVWNSIQSIVLAVLFFGAALTASPQAPETPELSTLLSSGKTHRHPLGFTFRYPPTWTVQQTDDGVSLIPSDATSESYSIITEEVEGISRPDDPSLIQALDEQISELAPFLRRVGKVESVKTGGGLGALMTWEGRNPNGFDVRTYVFVTIFKEHVIYLVASIAKERIASYDPTLRAIFATFGLSEAAPPTASTPSGALGFPPAANPLAAADPYVGTFKDDRLTIALKGGGGQYTGTIEFNGQAFPVTARQAGSSLEGAFQSQGQSFAFTASLTNTTLTFSTGGTTYTLQKQAANPLAGTQPTNPLAGAQPSNPLIQSNTSQTGNLTGTYTLESPNGTSTMVLEQTANKLRGSLKGVDGSSFQLEGEVGSQGAKGFVSSEQGKLYFEAKLAGAQLELKIMELNPQTQQPDPGTAFPLIFQRQGGGVGASTAGTSSPLTPSQPQISGASPGSPVPQQPNPALNKKNGKTFRHPIGFTFWYPEGWKVQDTGNGLQLVPPDVSSNAQGATEAYLIIGQSAQGVSRPDDPVLIQYLESQLLTLLPFMRRTGQIESIQASSGPGALITWEGANPTGMQVRARVFAIILKGYGVALVALGDKPRVDAREPILREIFSTFGFGEGEKDPRLIGTWRYESYYSSSSSGYSSGNFSSTSIRYMVFQPDGTFRSGSRLFASTDAVTADTGEDPGERGRWSAGNSKLYLMWDDGSYAEHGYYIEGQPGSQKMLLKPTNGSKEQLWEQAQ